MKLKAKIIAIIVAVFVLAGVVTLCVTLGKNCGGSSETVSASEKTSESVSESESGTSGETTSGTESESGSDSAEHTHSGGTATCTKKAVCEVCGEEYGEKAAHDFSAKKAEEKYLANAATCEKAAEYYVSCAVCGEKGEETFESGEALGHILSEKFVSLGNGKHAKKCEREGCSHTEEEADCAGGEATCEKKAVCEVCGGEYGETKAHEFIQNPDNKYLVSAASCTSSAVYVKSCKTCGTKGTETFAFGSPKGHNYGNKYISDGKGGHYKSCSRCNAKTATEACSGGEATCKELAVCSVCGGKYGKTVEHSYTKEVVETKYLAEAATCVSPAKYYKLCEFCGETGEETFENGEKLGHSMSTDLKSLKNGKHAKVCANCDYTEDEADCSGGTATCTEKAVCEICHEEYGDEPSHKWDDGVITTEKTCLANGVRTFTCSVCSATKTEVIESNGHTYTDEVVEPGCDTKGYTKHECSICGDTYTDNETEPKGHEWDKAAVTCTEGRECLNCNAKEPAANHNYVFDRIGQEATCTDAATEIHKCTKCKDEQTVVKGVPNGHTRVAKADNDKLQAGKDSCYYIKGFECGVCGADITDDIDEKFEKHEYVASIATAATCKTAGVKKFVCSKCGDSKEEEIAADEVNGHVWNGGVSDGNGKKTFICTVCSTTKTVIDATGKTEAVVSADDITEDTSEIHLDGASMDLGGVKDKLTGDVTVGANTIDEKTKNDLLSGEDKQEIKDRIGDSPIYDFTLTNNGEKVDFKGNKVKVVLPYTLEDGEDADSIAIWYIDDDGNVKSYIATYYVVEGKGYVTFEAEHFSYYTVTRLTPAERCALYGHSEKTFDIVRTCTDDGYTLHVCLRCGYEYKTDETKAEGHTYTVTTDEATCLKDGKITRTCQNCTFTYDETIKATGHDWKVTENVAADCTQAGKTVYTCGNCKETYTVTEAQKSHTFEEKTVAPTCETAGYTEKTCKECNYSYKENYVQALGHNYKASFSWSEDNLSATLCMTCENDSKHNVEIAAVVTSVETKATCASPAKTAYTAKAEFNGELYIEKKDVVTGEETLEHKFGEGYSYNDESHYRVCTLCGYIAEEAEHELSDGEIIKSATCSAYGEKVYVCETCGYVRKDVIPATGEHYYIDGYCAYCGAEYTACDHTTLTPKLLKSEDLGVCEGSTFVVFTCACGKVKKLDMKSLNLQCDIDGDDETNGSSESGKTADGKYYEKFTVACKKCGAIFEEYMEDPDGDCMYGYTGYVKITKNNVVTLNAIAESIEHHPSKTEIKKVYISDLTSENVCGGCFEIEVCSDCGGYTNDFDDGFVSDLACENIFENPVKYEYVDKNGVVHSGAHAVCEKCGLEIFVGTTALSLNECIVYSRIGLQVVINENVIFEYCLQEGVSAEHEYEETYELLGETCEDGVKYINTCKKCGAVETSFYYGHKSSSEERVDLPEGTCGGYFEKTRCDICGKVLSVHENVYNYHSFDSVSEEKETDENGIEHTITLYKCNKCGLEVLSDTYQVPREKYACEVFVYITDKISYNGELIYTYRYSYGQDDHDCKETAKLQEGAKTCEEGVVVTSTCKICGKVINERVFYGHVGKNEEIKLGEPCGGSVRVYRCMACGEGEIMNSYELSDYHSFERQEPRTYKDENGYEHELYVVKCSKCGLVYSKDSYVIPDENNPCEAPGYRTETVTSEDKTVNIIVSSSFRTYDHIFVYTFELEGKTCDDGWTAKGKCVICGGEDEQRGYGHSRLCVEYYDLAAYGACGGSIRREACACGEINEIDLWHSGYNMTRTDMPLGEGESSHTKYVYTCTNCELKIEEEDISKKVSDKEAQTCITYITETWHVTVGDKFVADLCVERVSSAEHNFTYTGKLKEGSSSCEEGVILYRTCADCGYSEVYDENYRGHYTELAWIDLPGECGGELEVNRCMVCEKVVSFEYYGSGNHSFMEKNEGYTGDDGLKHSRFINTCSKCGLTYGYDEYKVPRGDNPCEFVTCRTYIITSEDGTVDYSYTDSYNSESHQYVFMFELNGKTCEDGWTATGKCAVCQNETTASGSWHQQMLVEYYDLAKLGACEGTYIGKYSCACGANQNFAGVLCDDMRDEVSEIKPADDEYSHTRTTLSCDKCGLKIEEETIAKKVSDKEAHTCNIYYTTTRNVAVGETGVANIEIKRVETNSHNSLKTVKCELKEGSRTCDDGIIVYLKCEDCGYTDEYESYGHEYYIVETHKLENSVCGGTAYYMECACRQRKTVDYSCNCEFHSYGDGTEIEGTIKHGSLCYFNVGDLRNYDGTYYNDNLLSEHITQRLWNNNTIYKCAVTNPKQCGYVIRILEYWVKTANCTATRYITWQFGYNENDGTCEWEKTVATNDVQVYHDFEKTEINEDGVNGHTVSGYNLKCKDCDSYFNLREYRNEKGVVEKVELVSENLAENGGIKKHTHTIVLDVENNNKFGSEICTVVDADGNEHVSKRTKTAYDADNGFTDGIRSIIETDDYYHETKYANHEIKNGEVIRVLLYEMHIVNRGTENQQTEEWTYTYDFDHCRRTVVYKNGAREETSEEINHLDMCYRVIVKEPTCSQRGTIQDYCENCGEITSIDRIWRDHSWIKVAENHYVCEVCGLENANGVSGDIIMEDLTDYDNGEDYVVGYNFIGASIDKYNLVVSLVRKTALNDVNDEIYLDMSASDFVITEDIVSVRFKKKRVEELALAKLAELKLNIEDYNVRFSFTPNGFKEDIDYAITFEKIEYPSEITGNDETVCIFRKEEVINGVEISFTPTENCDLVINAFSYDLSVRVFNASGEEVSEDAFNACMANLIYLRLFKVEAGKTYTIKIKTDVHYGSNYYPVVISGCTDVTYNYGHTLNGKRIDYRSTIIFADMDEFESSGIKLFGNTELSCDEDSQGIFICDDCKELISVTIRLAHNHD